MTYTKISNIKTLKIILKSYLIVHVGEDIDVADLNLHTNNVISNKSTPAIPSSFGQSQRRPLPINKADDRKNRNHYLGDQFWLSHQKITV